MILEECCYSRGSNKEVLVSCDYRTSPKCRREWKLQYRRALDTMQINGGNISCIHCGPKRGMNRKYEFNSRLMEVVDNEEKAYLLGWIASDGSIGTDGKIQIVIHEKDEGILHTLKNIVSSDIPIWPKDECYRGIRICSKYFKDDVCRHLNILPGKKSNTVGFPEFNSKQLSIAFIRGIFDGDGGIKDHFEYSNYPACLIRTASPRMREGIHRFCRGCIGKNCVSWSGYEAIEFLSDIYNTSKPELRLKRKYDLYLSWAGWESRKVGKHE